MKAISHEENWCGYGRNDLCRKWLGIGERGYTEHIGVSRHAFSSAAVAITLNKPMQSRVAPSVVAVRFLLFPVKQASACGLGPRGRDRKRLVGDWIAGTAP
jgi:hypothetical protein